MRNTKSRRHQKNLNPDQKEEGDHPSENAEKAAANDPLDLLRKAGNGLRPLQADRHSSRR